MLVSGSLAFGSLWIIGLYDLAILFVAVTLPFAVWFHVAPFGTYRDAVLMVRKKFGVQLCRLLHHRCLG